MADEERVGARHSDQTRDRLLTAGLNLLATKGYRGAITREIALEAGVTEVTMYRHFRSKEELFAAAIAKHGEQLLNLVPEPSGDVEADLLMLATRFLEHISSLPMKLIRLSSELKEYPKPREAICDLTHRFRAKTLSLIRYYQAAGELIQDADDVVVTAFVGPLYYSSLDVSADNTFDCHRYVRFFLNGYRSEGK